MRPLHGCRRRARAAAIARLNELKMPLLLLWGGDVVFPASLAATIMQAVPSGRRHLRCVDIFRTRSGPTTRPATCACSCN
jgi:hypothetical protein